MKRAFTLIELLVYMAILGFIIVVAGRVFSDSTVMRVRSQSMVRTSEEVGRVSNLIREDLSQMGAKAWGDQDGSGSYTVSNVGSEIYWSASSTGGDSSSYALFHRNGPTTGTFCDSIVFRKADFDNAGRFIGIRQISWAASPNSDKTCKLVRSCKTIQECTVAPCGDDKETAVCNETAAVIMDENVTNFNIIPAKPGSAGNAQDVLFEGDFKLIPKNTGTNIVEIASTSISTGGTETTVSNFAQNANKGDPKHNELYLAKSTGSTWSDCELLTFVKDETYAIEFKMPLSSNFESDDDEISGTQFVPGRDHLAIGLRKNTSPDAIRPPDAPYDILFYPAQSADAAELKRHVEFSVKDTVKACIAITMAYYSPAACAADGKYCGSKGKLKFSNFKVFRKADETFHFLKPGDAGYDDYGTQAITDATERIKQKTNAKAFELILEIESRGEKSGTFSSNGKGMVITTPNNGVTPQI